MTGDCHVRICEGRGARAPRLLDRLGRTIGGERAGSSGWVYVLGIAGQRLAYPGRQRFRRPWTPGRSHLRHSLAVSELYVELREVESQAITNLRRFDAEPECWRSFAGPGGSPVILKPDAFVTVETDDYQDVLFIEQDCATESMTRIAEKAKTYVHYWQSGKEQEMFGVFPRVLWITPDAHRAEQIVEELARLPADQWQLFAVTQADGGAAWITAGEQGGQIEISNRKEVNE